MPEKRPAHPVILDTIKKLSKRKKKPEENSTRRTIVPRGFITTNTGGAPRG